MNRLTAVCAAWCAAGLLIVGVWPATVIWVLAPAVLMVLGLTMHANAEMMRSWSWSRERRRSLKFAMATPPGWRAGWVVAAFAGFAIAAVATFASRHFFMSWLAILGADALFARVQACGIRRLVEEWALEDTNVAPLSPAVSTVSVPDPAIARRIAEREGRI